MSYLPVKIIYRNLVQRPKVNGALDAFGRAVNTVANPIGLNYATGLTRNRAALFASSDPAETAAFKSALLATGRHRAQWAVEDFNRTQIGLPKKTLADRIMAHPWVFDVRPDDPACFVAGMGMGGEKSQSKRQDIVTFLSAHGVINPKQKIQAILKTGIDIEWISSVIQKIKDHCCGNYGLFFNFMPSDLSTRDEAEDITDSFLVILTKWDGKNAEHGLRTAAALLKTGTGPGRTTSLIFGILSSWDVMHGLDMVDALPEFIAKGYSDQEISLFYLKIQVFRHLELPYFLKLMDRGLSLDNIIECYNMFIIHKYGTHTIGYKTLQSMLMALLDADFSPTLIKEIVRRIATKKPSFSYGLPSHFEKALKLQKESLSADQRAELFGHVIENFCFDSDTFCALETILSHEETTRDISKTKHLLAEIARSETLLFHASIAIDKLLRKGMTIQQTYQILDACLANQENRLGDLFVSFEEELYVLTEAGMPNESIVKLYSSFGNKTLNTADKDDLFNFLIENLSNVDEWFLGLCLHFGLLKQIVSFINNDQTNRRLANILILNITKKIEQTWSRILNGRPPEELPRVFEFCTKVMAEKALKTYEKISEITQTSKKPTVTVYILSTAYKLCIEDTAWQLRQEGYSAEEAQELAERFQNEVAVLEKEGQDTLVAGMTVGQKWINSGIIKRFSQPEFIKIPSGSAPREKAVQRLKKLSDLAVANNWDIIFVDHSTVRTPDVIHSGDVSDFEKGRAIARGLEIVDPQGLYRKWVYKINAWASPDLSQEKPNMVGLNLYDGRIYESHTGGQKSEWLPVDDHGEFIGVSWDEEGNPKYNDQFVVVQSKTGKYHVYTASQIFDRFLMREIEKLRAPVEKTTIKQKNILFVCNANHDRSPLAEHLMRKMIETRVENASQIKVSSAGLETEAWLKKEGQKKGHSLIPSSGTRGLLEQKGIDFSKFSKHQISEQMADEADIIFVMTQREKRVLNGRFPEIAHKIYVLREYAEYAKEDIDLPTPKTFNYQTAYIFEEALERALKRMSGEALETKVRRVSRKPFRGKGHSAAA